MLSWLKRLLSGRYPGKHTFKIGGLAARGGIGMELGRVKMWEPFYYHSYMVKFLFSNLEN